MALWLRLQPTAFFKISIFKYQQSHVWLMLSKLHLFICRENKFLWSCAWFKRKANIRFIMELSSSQIYLSLSGSEKGPEWEDERICSCLWPLISHLNLICMTAKAKNALSSKIKRCFTIKSFILKCSQVHYFFIWYLPITLSIKVLTALNLLSHLSIH